jgi:DNA-binding MarR family transcriptional regulator
MQDLGLPRQDLPADSVGVLIGTVRRLLKRALWPHLAPHHLTPQQLRVLLVLREGEWSLHQLAESVCADDPTASRLVRALSVRRLIRVGVDPTHRRRFRLSLTPKGRRLAGRLKHTADELKARMEQGLTSAERAALRRSLRKVIANLRGEPKGSPRGARRTPARTGSLKGAV